MKFESVGLRKSSALEPNRRSHCKCCKMFTCPWSTSCLADGEKSCHT